MANHPTNAAAANPFVWFAELWLARQAGDCDREARARRQLRLCGVDVLIDGSVVPFDCSLSLPGSRRKDRP